MPHQIDGVTYSQADTRILRQIPMSNFELQKKHPDNAVSLAMLRRYEMC